MQFGQRQHRPVRPSQQPQQIPLKRFLKVGDALENGYTLTEVHPNKIVLSRNRQQSGTVSGTRLQANLPSTLAANARAARRQPPISQQVQGMMMRQQLQMIAPAHPRTPRSSGRRPAPRTTVAPEADNSKQTRYTNRNGMMILQKIQPLVNASAGSISLALANFRSLAERLLHL